MNAYHLKVDGSNVANSVKNERKKAKLRNLILLMQYLDEIGSSYPIEYEILVDATLPYTIDRFKDYSFNPAHDFALCDYMILFDRVISPRFKMFVESLKSTIVPQEAAKDSA